MVKALLFSFLLLASHLNAYARGSVDVVPNATLYSAYIGAGCAGKWSTSKMASASDGVACYQRVRGGTSGSQYDACWYITSYSVASETSMLRKTQIVSNTAAQLECNVTTIPPDQYLNIDYSSKVQAACPQNASGTPTDNPTSCTCDGGYKPDATAKSCVADCSARETSSSGFYDIGTSAGASPTIIGCRGNCEVIFDGSSPAGSAIVEGQKHWYAKGAYINTGGACKNPGSNTGGSKEVGDGKPTKPEDSCKAGQAVGTVNGKSVCVDQGSGSVDPETKDKATSKTEKQTAQNPDGSTTETETTTKTDANGKQTVTVTKKTTKPDGSVTTETEITAPPGQTPGDGSGEKPDDSEKGECEKNSSAAGCGGEPATYGDLYQPKDKAFSSVLGSHRDAFLASPIGGAVGGFFTVSGGGSCPTWTARIPYIDADITIDQFCTSAANTALLILKTCILLVASFMAFRIAVE